MLKKIYLNIAPIAVPFLLFLYIMLSLKSCGEEKALIDAIDGRAANLEKFLKEGEKVKRLELENGHLMFTNKTLVQSEAALKLITQDLKIKLDNQPISVTHFEGAVTIVKDTVRLELPCEFDTLISKIKVNEKDSTRLDYSYTFRLTNRHFILDSLNVPFSANLVITKKNRFLRNPLYETILEVDNKHVSVSSLSSAVVQEKKGFKVLPFLVVAGGAVIIWEIVR